MSDSSNGDVLLTAEQYAYLADRDWKLTCLESGGVDNWVWYGDAMKIYREGEEEEDE